MDLFGTSVLEATEAIFRECKVEADAPSPSELLCANGHSADLRTAQETMRLWSGYSR